jgi:hypothetical protein
MVPVCVMPSPAALVDQDVGRLEVAVDDSFLVSGSQSAGYLLHDVDRFAELELAPLLEQLVKVLALYELHGDELDTLGLAQVIDPDHIPMGHLG